MPNRFGIPDDLLQITRKRDDRCVYCQKEMVVPSINNPRNDWATIEHLNRFGPFYWKERLEMADIVICCFSCNSSRGVKKLVDWFQSAYCVRQNINEQTVAEPVKKYLATRRAGL